MSNTQVRGRIVNIERYRIYDGDGIRTNVFLKGCPLFCPWCCNPETQRTDKQMSVFSKLCKMCAFCVRVCPQNAISVKDGRLCRDESKCTFCGRCERYCPHNARKIYGKDMSADEVVAELIKDEMYFSRSDDGVTISGGEPCMQPEFTHAIMAGLKKWQIHTALETSGAVPWEALWTAAELADVILLDLKSTTAEDFQTVSALPFDEYTQNMRQLCQRGKQVVLRCPIVPEKNFTPAHLHAIGRLAVENGIRQVDLLAFHQLGKHKYEALHMPYELVASEELDKALLAEWKLYLEELGLQVTIGG